MESVKHLLAAVTNFACDPANPLININSTFPTKCFGMEADPALNNATLSIPQIVWNILTVMLGSITAVCVTVFIAGAFFYAISAGDDQRKNLGKELMIGAVIGIGIIAGARGILEMAYFFLYYGIG